MLRHGVLFKLRLSLDAFTALMLLLCPDFDALQAIKRHIPGIIEICCGADVSPENCNVATPMPLQWISSTLPPATATCPIHLIKK